MPGDAPGLLLCDDLIFTSKITGTAKALGLVVQQARTLADLLTRVRGASSPCVILDLHFPGLEVATLVPQLRELGAGRIVGYGSHVEAETLRAARVAGCDPVWPRSKFVEDLATALPGWLGTQPEPPS